MLCTECDSICLPVEEGYTCPKCGASFEQSFLPLIVETVEPATKARKEVKMKNILVTQTNISSVPIDWLCARYQRLKRRRKFDNQQDLNEMELIENYLQEIGKAELIGFFTSYEQMEMDIPVAMRQQYAPIVEHRLKEHYRHCQRKVWIEAAIPKANANLRAEPTKLTATYGNLAGVTGGGGIHNPIEASFIRAVEKIERLEQELVEIEERMEPMQKALLELDFEQLSLIEAKYFCREEPIDDTLINSFGWGRQKYYTVKKTALITLATTLKVI